MKYLLLIALILLPSCISIEYTTSNKEDYQDNAEVKEYLHDELYEFHDSPEDTLTFDPHRNLIFE